MFQNNYDLTCYLHTVKLVMSSTSKHSVNITKSNIKYISHTIKRKMNRHPDGENHIVAVSERKIVKRKDIYEGENISEVPKDGIFDALPS